MEKYIPDPHTAVAWNAFYKLDDQKNVVIVSTASPYKFTRSVMSAIDPKYMEDEDLCLRAWEQGTPVLYYPEAEFIHHHLRSSTHLSKRTLQHLKSLMIFFHRHGFNYKRNIIGR